ncbi:MAG: type II toxin-antitoxin system RelE/ParE family toxin [Anaerolineae bacterium]|nr:type II toxin-antitoxin system RelE/ParE family toxin [Anaerolineae bacterium]
MRTIHFYRTEGGYCPVEEFLDSLTGKQAQKALWVLRLVEELDVVPGQYFKKLVGTEDIWEVRAQFGGDVFRMLGFFAHSSFLVLTSGFTKKSRKTPRQEIALATQRKHDYLSRQEKS